MNKADDFFEVNSMNRLCYRARKSLRQLSSRRPVYCQLQELGVKPRPEAEALVDMARTLIVLGVAKPTFSS